MHTLLRLACMVGVGACCDTGRELMYFEIVMALMFGVYLNVNFLLIGDIGFTVDLQSKVIQNCILYW